MPLNPKVMVGGTEIKRAYQGAVLLFDRTSPDVSIVTDIPEVEAVFVAEPAYLYTDAGVTNVTASGDAVQEWHSTDGNVVVSLVGSGVTYQESGGLAWVEGDGNGRLQGPVPDTWVPDMMLAVAATDEDGTQHTRPMTIGDANRISDQHNLQLTDDGKSGIRDRDFVPDPSIDCWTTFTTATSTAYVINAVINTSSNRARARINGSTDQEADTPGASQVVGIYTGETTDELCFCGEPGTSPENTFNKIFGAVIAIGIPTTEDRGVIDDWLASISGATLDGVTP